jgi:hypothetical protein
MKILSWGSWIAASGIVCLVGSTGSASITRRDNDGHQSSLRATVTATDGTFRAITLQGVGCTISLCSRVRVNDTKSNSVWLDGLASVQPISQDADGSVRAIFTFKDGAEHQASVVAGNRVLYVQGRFGRTERLDLASLTKIDFK